MSNNRRKTLLVDAVRQRRIILSAVLGAVIIGNITLLLVLMAYPSAQQHLSLIDTLIIAAAEFIMVGFIAYYSLLLSHKIAGPAYALLRDLSRLSSGDLTVRTRLRDGDFYREVGDRLCATTEDLCIRISCMQANVAVLSQQGGLRPETTVLIGELQKQLAHFKTIAEPQGRKDVQEAGGDGL